MVHVCPTGEECVCRDWHGCIMAQKIVGQEDVQPYKFSECSKTDYVDALRMGHGLCLLNKPNEVSSTTEWWMVAVVGTRPHVHVNVSLAGFEVEGPGGL